jgi:imidazolonepropionase-like amidohydrolase
MSRRVGWSVGVLGLVFLWNCAHAPPVAASGDASNSATAFVDVTVVPMDTERLVPGQTVLIQDGRITALGPTESTPVPPGARRIDGRGRYLMPGLADMHVHLFFMAEGDLRIFLANGVTFVRGMWGTPRDLQWRERIARGELLGPTLVTAGPLIDGKPPIWDESVVAETFADGERIVLEQKKAGYDFIKVYNRLTPEAYAGLVATAKREGLPFAGHVPFSMGLEGVFAAGQRSIEHLTGYLESLQAENSEVRGKWDWASRLRQIDYVDEAKLLQVVEATKQSGIWNCPTLFLPRRYVSSEEAQVLARQPEMRFVASWVREMWEPSKDFRLKDLTAEDFARLRRRDALLLKVTRALHDAGARLLLGTDTGNPYVLPGFSVHEELALLVQAGLTPYEALRAGTRDAAEFIGQLEEFGTVAPGKRADLLLLEANPLEDVANARRRSGVMVRGRWLPEEELRAMLEEVAASYASPQAR